MTAMIDRISLDRLPYALDALPTFYRRNYDPNVPNDVTVAYDETTKLPTSVTTTRANLASADVLFSMQLFCGGKDKQNAEAYGCTPNAYVGEKSKERHCAAKLRIDFFVDVANHNTPFARFVEVGTHGKDYKAPTTKRTHYTDKIAAAAIANEHIATGPIASTTTTSSTTATTTTNDYHGRQKNNFNRRWQYQMKRKERQMSPATTLTTPISFALDFDELFNELENDNRIITATAITTITTTQPIITSDNSDAVRCRSFRELLSTPVCTVLVCCLRMYVDPQDW